ncbi:MAG: SPFH domain-containing protein [Clostridia bacterium]|nr:SPFH domain-containing protein [Clostridia bacterium]
MKGNDAMGIMDFIKGQFIDVIEWVDTDTDAMVWKFERKGNEIKMGAQLTVRESQAAVFVNEGQIADVFQPGRYELSTQNLPILTTLKSWKYGFNSPFKADVFFVNMKQFTNRKWGTANPIIRRDSDFGIVRLRAFGIYSFKVDDPAQFLREIFGTNPDFETGDIEGQLKRQLVSGLSDSLAESKIPVLDMAMNYDELGVEAVSNLQPRFTSLGLKLVSLYIENVSLPEEVEKVLDKKTQMGVVGDMKTFTQYQTAEAIRDAAQNEGGGTAGAGVGLGAGVAMGKAMADAMKPDETVYVKCSNCGSDMPADAKFCPECGTPAGEAKAKCVKCGASIVADAKFCPECGSPQQSACKNCGNALIPGAKFCPECGTKV